MTDQNNFWKDWQDDAEGGGAGLIVLDAELGVGFRNYISGQTGLHKITARGDEANKVAMAAANAEAETHGLKKLTDRDRGLYILCPMASSYKFGAVVTTWSGDRVFSQRMWAPASREVLAPSFQEHNIVPIPPLKKDIRIGWKKDPSGYERENMDGEMEVQLVEYIAEVFPNREAALAAIAEMGEGTTSSTSIPAGFTEEEWTAKRLEIAKFLASGTTAEQLAGIYDVDQVYIDAIAAEVNA